MGRARLSLLAGLFGSALLLVAVVVWAMAAPATAPPRGADAAQPLPTTVTPSVTPVRPVPPSMPTAHPGVGAVIGARATYPPTPNILNHAAFNLSLDADCPGCPVPILGVLGLNPANEGVLASYELNPSNARQQLSDNWEWYWPKVTDTLYLWASAPQEPVGDDWRPLFTPGMIYIQRAAWHQDPQSDMHQPRSVFCVVPTGTPGVPPVTPGGPPVFNVDPEPTVGYVIAPPFPLGTFTPTPTEGPPLPVTPTPGPTMLPTAWKYWACAGPLTDPVGLPTFAMYDRDGFVRWIDDNRGMQYIVGNEEEYYMLPEAYAAWYKLIYGIMRVEDPTAELYISGLGVWHYTFGPGLDNVVPVAYKDWQAPPNPTAPPTPGGEGPYPPPPTAGGYPPPGGGEAVVPLRPAVAAGPPSAPAPPPGAPAGVLDGTPLPTLLPRAFGEAQDWARASWLPAVLLAYRNLYCPEHCVDDAGQPPPPAPTPHTASAYNRMPSAGFMAHLYATSPDLVLDSCADAATSYTDWVHRLEFLSHYFQRWEDYVINDSFYLQETGIINGAYIDYKDAGPPPNYRHPWYPESQTCDPDFDNPTYYQGCLAAVDLSNRLSWYIVEHGQDLPGAQATGTSFLSADQYHWQGELLPPTPGPPPPPSTPPPTAGVPYIEWMPLGRGSNCQGYEPRCPTNAPDVDWSVSPNAYGFFLGARGTPSTFCAGAEFTPVPLTPLPFPCTATPGPTVTPGGPTLTPTPTPSPRPTDPLPPPAEQLGPRPYGPVYGWEAPAGMDFDPPTSAAVTLTTWQTTAAFPVTWEGQDDAFGIMSYDVQYSSSLPLTWTGWLTWTTATSATFGPGVEGTTYCFRSRARDWGYALEDWPADPGDTCTTPDLTPPSSQVITLPAYSRAQFTVSWSGSDATSGVADYDVQVCQGACPPPQGIWSEWLGGTTATSASFTGEHGQTYHFRSRAQDNAGNEELYPAGSDTWTIVDTRPPSTTVEPLDLYTFTISFTVTWHGADDLSGLAHYDIYYRDESQANWVLWLEDVTITQSTFLGSPGHTYHFCSRGVDNVGNTENCPPACIQGDQCGWPIQSDAQIGVAPWSRVDDLLPTTAQTTFSVCWSGLDGQWYDVYVRDGLYGRWSKWQKETYLTCDSYTGAYGHVYYFYSVGMNEHVWEEPPYDWDAYTKLVSPTEGEGAAGGDGAFVLLFPDEAPDRIEEVTSTQALGIPVVGYIAPAGDVDWYRFELPESMRLRIQLADLPADYDLYVFDGSGQFRWASTWGRQLPEEVVVRVPAGVYYLRLDGYAGACNGEVPYWLLVERVGH